MQIEIIYIVSGILLLIAVPMLTNYFLKKIIEGPDYIIKISEDLELNSIFEAEIGNKIYFSTGNTSLSLDAIRQIKRQADWLVRNPDTEVIVDGYCDVGGGAGCNLSLGLRRSENTKECLVEYGVTRSRIQVSSPNKLTEQTDQYDPDSWEDNRMVTLTISKVQQ